MHAKTACLIENSLLRTYILDAFFSCSCKLNMHQYGLQTSYNTQNQALPKSCGCDEWYWQTIVWLTCQKDFLCPWNPVNLESTGCWGSVEPQSKGSSKVLTICSNDTLATSSSGVGRVPSHEVTGPQTSTAH